MCLINNNYARLFVSFFLAGIRMAERKVLNGSGSTNNHHDEGPPLKRTRGWIVPTSNESKGAINSIRMCEERHFNDALEKRDKSRDLIKLSIGIE